MFHKCSFEIAGEKLPSKNKKFSNFWVVQELTTSVTHIDFNIWVTIVTLHS